MHLYTYLALGDSYTIGEGVPVHQSLPYRTVSQLRKLGFSFCAPEIVAATGWTTTELEAATKQHEFLPKYDLVTLLIGVNDQYRGLDAISYKENFEALLKQAISFGNGKKEHITVISIPDYSITPHSANSDKEKIAREIDVFNTINRALSIQYKVSYLDITPQSREAALQDNLIGADGLHPSAAGYEAWAALLAESVAARLK